MGSSRSATIVVLYLMRNHGMTFTEAYTYLKSRREVVNMNITFADELRDCEKYTRNLDLTPRIHILIN